MLQDFPNGILHLPQQMQEIAPSPERWLDNPVYAIAYIVSILCLLAGAKSIVSVVPLMRQCIPFGRTNVELEHRLPMKRSRAIGAWCCIPACALIIERFRPEDISALLCLITIAAYFITRHIIYIIPKHKKMPQEPWDAAKHCILNSVIWFAFMAVMTVCLWHAFKWNVTASWIILLVLAAILILLQLKQVAEIFILNYSRFSTFLYLCALEIVPAALTAALAIVLEKQLI